MKLQRFDHEATTTCGYCGVGCRLETHSRDGKIQWTTKLPGATTWSGPVLAGNRLWLTSNKGHLLGVDAATGRVESTQEAALRVSRVRRRVRSVSC